ncbi:MULTISPECIES: arginine--tRNA ligase [unclassified Enterococcus]|uniref:arginine--tRNA ligase n=1 Tax=unclassified Enterococcus TaxID=2608891 RepID=UPI0015543B4E|nr:MULTISPECIES: arginine--tRNA ligase [unclassified Enterococcus]MBS7575951.1 arginine--tRNA ligase [Enterococcus sp. MMGLQ5-2]MBS7583184.1 arginine--tRNA ligase [Enterococcus sp. MMGLQ5-1]NPD11044.1 arginine--tRNA ligase [Enterococcus sp. MMGLQ5-1]NPD35787.1 arginine--tRNA ligase [Enterococcus sp. MMGLQ5-2]
MNERALVAKNLFQVLNEYLTPEEIEQLLEKPKSKEHGDVAFPTFVLAKVLRKAPQVIAKEIAEKLNSDDFEKIEVVGPYLNFFLNKIKVSHDVLSQIITEEEAYGSATIGAGENIVIDMSSPNIAKPFSMGHLRSTVIGNALSNISQKLGYQTIKINHLGDWGTQFGMLITAYKKWGTKAAIDANPINELLALYVKINKLAKEDPTLKDEARAWFKKLEDGNEEAIELWNWFKSESLKEFNRIYQLLSVNFDSYNGEAFYNDKMSEIVDLLAEKALLTESQGATIVDLERYDLLPALIKKSDGATLYITRDLAAAVYRKRTYHFKKALYVVGNEQSGHFKQLKAVIKEMGYDWSEQITHVPFGLITKDGKKLSTREGNVVLLEEVLNEADQRALNLILEKNPNLPNPDLTAHQVGTGAVIFHDLKNDRLNNFDFNLDEVVQFEGETGPYVQYTRARSISILNKANFKPDQLANYYLEDAESWEVIKLLQAFPEVVKRAFDKLEPSVIAKHAIQLAQTFNKYYAHVRILDDNEEKESRLALVYAVQIVLKTDLTLLGVSSPDQM